MARARFIRPEFFSDVRLSEMPFGARILFAAIWCHSDLRGVFEHCPKMLRAQAFPHDEEVTSKKVQEWLDLLQSHGRISRFESGGKTWGCVTNWTKHQHISKKEKETGTTRPEPPPIREPSQNGSGTNPEPCQSASPTLLSSLLSPTPSPTYLPAGEQDISQPSQGAKADPWQMERLEPWAAALIKAGCKIGSGNWTAWKALVDEHGLEVVLAAAKGVSATERFNDAVEAAIKKNHGRITTRHSRYHKVTL